LGDTVITEITLLGYMVYRMEEPHSIRAGHDTITTPDAPFLVHQDHPVCGLICGAHRAYLDTGGLFALVTELGHKKSLIDVLGGNISVLSHSEIDPRGGESVPGFLGGIGKYFSVFGDHVSFNPGSRDIGVKGNLIFEFACLDTEAAADALVGIHEKYPAEGFWRSMSGSGPEDFNAPFHQHQGG
jgi:hypothetical protein